MEDPVYHQTNFEIPTAAGYEHLHSIANVSITMNVYLSMFIAIVIGSLATSLTSYCILCLDFIFNLLSCINIIQIHHKIPCPFEK